MKKYRFTPQAKADLFDIWNFIAEIVAKLLTVLRRRFFAPVTSFPILRSWGKPGMT
jgi:hypothetical protein